MVACGPPGLNGDSNILYHNNGDGTFTDVSEKAGILKANGTYGLGVLVGDFDNDGFPDIYVADDSTASAMYRNLQNGTFKDVGMEAGCVLSPDGKPQAGMGVSAGDYNLDGNLDILKTNFAGDTPSLYQNRGDWNFEDSTFVAGLGAHTQYLGWGCGFFDYDNDGWPDILICNGHVYPEVEQLKTEAGYPQRKLLYKNGRNGRFHEVTDYAGPGILDPYPSRGCAFGDWDNDGDVDFVVNGVNSFPQLVRCDSRLDHNWIKVKCIGVKSNRSAIGARLKCVTQPPAQRHRCALEVRDSAAGRAQAASADRRGPQRRRLYLAKRPAHSLRHRHGRKDRPARSPLAQRPDRHHEGCAPQSTHRGRGRQGHRANPAVRGSQEAAKGVDDHDYRGRVWVRWKPAAVVHLARAFSPPGAQELCRIPLSLA